MNLNKLKNIQYQNHIRLIYNGVAYSYYRKTLIAYINYILDVYYSHNLNIFRQNIHFKDYKLQEKHKITDRKLNRCLLLLESLDIIKCTNDANWSLCKSREYELNIERIIEVMNSIGMDSTYIPIYVKQCETYIPKNDIAFFEKNISLYNFSAEGYNFENVSLLNTQYIKKQYNIFQVRDAYEKEISKLSLVRDIKEQVETLRKEYGYNVKFPFGVKIRGNRLIVAGRQCTNESFMSRETRYEQLENSLYDSNYDIKSTIYAIARAVNKEEFDIEWDIKDELMKYNYKKIDGELITRQEYKSLLYRTFFEPSLAISWNHYQRNFIWDNKTKEYIDKNKKIDKRLPKIDKFTYIHIWNKVHDIIGTNWDKRLDRVIFILESLIELRIVHRLKKLNCDVKNIFDCFYIKRNQISLEELKNIISEEIITVCKKYRKELLDK